MSYETCASILQDIMYKEKYVFLQQIMHIPPGGREVPKKTNLLYSMCNQFSLLF